MKITIVMGFFLPMPPDAGGAIEKSWYRLAQNFVKRGHDVTVISRQWQNWPDDEHRNGVHHVRLKGFDHKKYLWQNLLCDLIWSWRVFFSLPTADIVALNTISLAMWLGSLKHRAGRVIAMPGRMPKGQFRLYPRLARILVPSSPVKEAVIKERPSFTSLIKTVGYPIDHHALARDTSKSTEIITISYVGRIHREKGIGLLIEAARTLTKQSLPSWQIIICGPSDLTRGGSGSDYLQALQSRAPSNVKFREAIYHDPELHKIYQSSHIFCYPSLSSNGETFGVSIAEAMAAGAVPVVSKLSCFLDFVIPDINGAVFDATANDASETLAAILAQLITDTDRRNSLADAAQIAVQPYDFDRYTDSLLNDFQQLTLSKPNPSSSP